MKKRIAIFTHGGIGTGNLNQGFPLITQLINRLAEEFDITLFSLSSFNKDFSPGTYKAYCVPREIKPQVFRWIYLIVRFLKDQRKQQHQVLYSFWGYPTGTVVVALGKIVNRPSVVNILGSESANIPEINYGHLRKFFSRKLIKWTCRNASELVPVTLCQMKLLKPYGVIRKTEVIPWGVNKDLFRSPKPLNPPLKIIHVANLTEVKDQETLLRAFQLIREKVPAKLRMVGPDYLNGKIQRQASDLGLSEDIEFIGFVAHQYIAEQYYWADAFMLTSLSEGQNNSITEAMMCGLLPIATSVGIMDDLGNDVGIVVKPGDYKNLANKVIALHEQPGEWKRRQQKAQAWAMEFDFDWTIRELSKLINRV